MGLINPREFNFVYTDYDNKIVFRLEVFYTLIEHRDAFDHVD